MLYRAGGGERTCAVVAAELGITGEALRAWVRKDAGANAPAVRGGSGPGKQADEPARLRAENARLVKAEKWQPEREIPCRAAAYFTGEVK